MSEFYLFFFKKELKAHLLWEIKTKLPELSLSFSNKQFLSFKAPENYLETLNKSQIIFAKLSAKFLYKDNNASENCVQTKPDEFWHYKPLKLTENTLNYREKDLPEIAPARAYLKMQQADEIFQLNIKSNDQVVEIGSAPGGISYYLLEKGCKVYAIDPAIMSPVVSENYGNKFEHVKKSIFDIDMQALPKKCDWLVSDLNLPGDLNINQCIKIMRHYPGLKGAFITLKTPEVDDIINTQKWTKLLPRYKKLHIVHLPAHKKELGFVIKY